MELMPQEIEVRYIIPSLRKELAKELNKEHKQREIAKFLNLTPAAVSQYLSKKRGTINFDAKLMKEIKISASKISKDNRTYDQEMYRLTNLARKSGFICQIHKKFDRIPKNCEICFCHENH